jgi:hypothetical protein
MVLSTVCYAWRWKIVAGGLGLELSLVDHGGGDRRRRERPHVREVNRPLSGGRRVRAARSLFRTGRSPQQE